MMIFWRQRLVILSNTKTGSTALMAALGGKADVVFRNPPGLKHSHLYRFQKFIQPGLDRVEAIDWEFFSVMREPLDWLGSWYRYRQRRFIEGRQTSTTDITFEEFMRDHLSDTPSEFSTVGNQTAFLTPMENTDPVQHVFAFDQQDKIKNFLEKRLKTTVNPPRINVSEPRDLTLSDATRALFMQRYADEIALYAAIRRRP